MDRLEETRASWNFATRQHDAHKVGQGAFLRTGSTLFDEEVALTGAVQGCRLLHVLCNAGQDTRSQARRGARVTGVDLSDEAVASAGRLATEAGLEARFVRAEVHDFLETTPERFDVVFGSYGCLPWIEDLPRFFAGVRRVLAPGGRIAVLEFHPLVFSLAAELRFGADPCFAPGVFSEPVGDHVAAPEGALSPGGHLAFEPAPGPRVAADRRRGGERAGRGGSPPRAARGVPVLERLPDHFGGSVRAGRRFAGPGGRPVAAPDARAPVAGAVRVLVPGLRSRAP